MSARRKRVISTEEIQFNHKPAKMLLTEKKKGVSQNGQTPSIIRICSYCVLDRPVFERCQTLLHPDLTTWLGTQISAQKWLPDNIPFMSFFYIHHFQTTCIVNLHTKNTGNFWNVSFLQSLSVQDFFQPQLETNLNWTTTYSLLQISLKFVPQSHSLSSKLS